MENQEKIQKILGCHQVKLFVRVSGEMIMPKISAYGQNIILCYVFLVFSIFVFGVRCKCINIHNDLV